MKNLLIGGIIVGESPLGTSWKLDLQQHTEIIIRMIWTSEPSLEDSILQAFPDAKLVYDINELLQDPEITLVLIAHRLEAEEPVIGKVLQSGKHVRVL